MSVSPTPSPTTSPDQPDPPQARGGGAALLGAALIGAGTLWLLASLGIDVPVAMVAPVLLVVLGIAVLVSAVRGVDHTVIGVAIAVGVWVAIAAVVTVLVDVPLSGSMGDRDSAPTTVAAAEEPQRLFAGQHRLDLRDLEPSDEIVAVQLSTVLGEIEVLVPRDVAVRVDASVAAGSIDLFGEVMDGVGLDQQVEEGDWDRAASRVQLQLRVGLGEVRVRTE